ncbi:disulfide bond formation protein B [Zwartia vadi]|uniref:disulfide bond formation protein B n=1 Tax=Zwartia vadi TaxID=3058168 RepID=UPI0025B608E8|nr:disulfide bond formation protein B [Zwartia vadi]MDN3986663.1 disulfide bond formation protein B [Zwartia vadi]
MDYSSRTQHSTEHGLSFWLNAIALAAVCGSLLEAFYWQIFFNELPCPLCQLQRVALTLAGIGMMLNVRFGPSAVHYAIILFSALGGATASARQILLHIEPGDAGYGSTLFGLHFYTWGFISFVVMLIFCAVMLCIDRNQLSTPRAQLANRPHFSTRVATLLIALFLLVTAANTISAIMVCQFGSCPDNPTEYLWKFWL